MIPKHIWIEQGEDNEHDACDVIVEMEDGRVYTAMFITLPYLRRQMDLSCHMAKQLDLPPVAYTALETPHIVLDDIKRETLEDSIDNMIAFDVFECSFTLVTDDDDSSANGRTNGDGKRATTEVAAVVINEVLSVSG
jgi:hypothetical protein